MSEEGYVAVDHTVLEAIREFAWVADYDRHALPAVRLMARVARIDPETGQVIIAVELIRDLDDERGPDSI